MKFKAICKVDDESTPKLIRRTSYKSKSETVCENESSIPDSAWIIRESTHVLRVPILWAADSTTIFYLDYQYKLYGHERLGHRLADTAPSTMKNLRMACSNLRFEVQHVLLSTQHFTFDNPKTLGSFCQSLAIEHQDSLLSVSLEPRKTNRLQGVNFQHMEWIDIEEWTNAVSWLPTGIRSVFIRLHGDSVIPEKQHRALYMIAKSIKVAAPEATFAVTRKSDSESDYRHETEFLSP